MNIGQYGVGTITRTKLQKKTNILNLKSSYTLGFVRIGTFFEFNVLGLCKQD
ncbi:hypothetical protein FHX85_001484 [Clostridium beijerinckii]|nr:hypothetical protein [Clostridium beijerinckii]